MLLAVLAVLAIGQVYQQGIRLPSDGVVGPVLEAINQLCIFSPLLLLLRIRHQPLSTAWISFYRLGGRLAAGLALALLAIGVYTTVREDSGSWLQVVSQVYHPRNFHYAVQVWLEDVAIAMMFIRLAAALGTKRTVLLVATLFAAGHIPAMVSGGTPWADLVTLILDAGLLAVILPVIRRSADIWWIWCVHFAMDMMQFYAVP
jgi:hypothetical protein